MKLIQVKYLAPTDTQGTRFSASAGWDGETQRITVGRDYALDYDDNVIAAARELVAKIWETNAPEVVPEVGKTRAGVDVVRLDFTDSIYTLIEEVARIGLELDFDAIAHELGLSDQDLKKVQKYFEAKFAGD